MSLFITGLAFSDPTVIDEAKLGILCASAIAAMLGMVVLSRANKVTDTDTPVSDEQPAPTPAEAH